MAKKKGKSLSKALPQHMRRMRQFLNLWGLNIERYLYDTLPNIPRPEGGFRLEQPHAGAPIPWWGRIEFDNEGSHYIGAPFPTQFEVDEGQLASSDSTMRFMTLTPLVDNVVDDVQEGHAGQDLRISPVSALTILEEFSSNESTSYTTSLPDITSGDHPPGSDIWDEQSVAPIPGHTSHIASNSIAGGSLSSEAIHYSENLFESLQREIFAPNSSPSHHIFAQPMGRGWSPPASHPTPDAIGSSRIPAGFSDPDPHPFLWLNPVHRNDPVPHRRHARGTTYNFGMSNDYAPQTSLPVAGPSRVSQTSLSTHRFSAVPYVTPNSRRARLRPVRLDNRQTPRSFQAESNHYDWNSFDWPAGGAGMLRSSRLHREHPDPGFFPQ